LVLGEREDGAVFYQSTGKFKPGEKEVKVEMARIILDNFLSAPLEPNSVGQFDVEPNFYLPGMSPAKI
jgi:hypothetical protein